MKLSKEVVLQIFNELTFDWLNNEDVKLQGKNLVDTIQSEFFVLDCIFKYGSFSDCEIINFNSLQELDDFYKSIEDETYDTKWSSNLYFSNGKKSFRYLDL